MAELVGIRPRYGTVAGAAQRPLCLTRPSFPGWAWVGLTGQITGVKGCSMVLGAGTMWLQASGYAQTSGSVDVMQKTFPSSEKQPPSDNAEDKSR